MESTYLIAAFYFTLCQIAQLPHTENWNEEVMSIYGGLSG